jgi:hypothetical protein
MKPEYLKKTTDLPQGRIAAVSTHIYYMVFVGTVTTEAATSEATTGTTGMNFYFKCWSLSAPFNLGNYKN